MTARYVDTYPVAKKGLRLRRMLGLRRARQGMHMRYRLGRARRATPHVVARRDRMPRADHLQQHRRGRRCGMSDWRDQASCLDSDPELFFPVGSTGPALIQIEDAKAVCRDCAVQEACLEWAIESGQNFGVWGALSEGERRNLKRRRARRGDAQPLLGEESAP